MPTISIPISQLDPINEISSSDLLASVQSSSLTTYKTTWGVVGAWISQSVQASSSLQAVTASYASQSSVATTASFAKAAAFLNSPNSSTASWAITASFAVTAAFAEASPLALFSLSASWASQSLWTTSASFASQSIWSTSSSFASQSSAANAALFASSSVSSAFATNASSASNAASASFATTASFVTAVPSLTYPYIQSITCLTTHDDGFDVNFGEDCFQFQENQYGANTITFQINNPTYMWSNIDFNPALGLYVGYSSNNTTPAFTNLAGYASGPHHDALMWADNRGGGNYNIGFSGSFKICFVTSPNHGITHSYATVAGNASYNGKLMKVIAGRASLGLFAVVDKLALSVYGYNNSSITSSFGTLTITTN
jgi:hypothetical protein